MKKYLFAVLLFGVSFWQGVYHLFNAKEIL